jgi:hypothetical protein
MTTNDYVIQNLNSACSKVLVPRKIFQFQDRWNENRFLGTFRGHSIRHIIDWISANPGLKFNLLFQFAYFCMSIYFKMSEKKTSIDPDMVCEEIFPNL